MKSTDKKKKICLLLSENVVNDFAKKTKQTGIKQNFVIEALLRNWLTKPVDCGVAMPENVNNL